MKTYVCILFGLSVIWTGLARSIEAVAFKPNAFYFCMTMGLLAIAAGYLIRVDAKKLGYALAICSGALVLGFYLYCFIVQPEKDANVRVGLVIVASFAHLAMICLPPVRAEDGAS